MRDFKQSNAIRRRKSSVRDAVDWEKSKKISNYRRTGSPKEHEKTDKSPPGTSKRILGILTGAGLKLAGLGAYGYYVGLTKNLVGIFGR